MVAGHEEETVESVIASGDDYVAVDKVGVGREVARRHDPRD